MWILILTYYIFWFIAPSVLFHQHVDDHSIIMADQTVIKKGEFSSMFVPKNHIFINLTKKKGGNAWGTCAFVQPNKDAVITGKGWKFTVRPVFKKNKNSLSHSNLEMS